MASPRDGLEGLLAQHTRFLAQAQACISTDVSAVHNDKYKEFILALSRRIEAHQIRLLAVGQNEHGADDAVQWGLIEATRVSRDGAGIVFNIHGPAAADKHVVKVEDEETASKLEVQLQHYGKMSKALARAYRQELAIAEIQRAREESTKQQPPVGSDQTRITLLKQYNDLRDVAQQFIGIIADNRGVPVRSLYADRDFGVGPED